MHASSRHDEQEFRRYHHIHLLYLAIFFQREKKNYPPMNPNSMYDLTGPSRAFQNCSDGGGESGSGGGISSSGIAQRLQSGEWQEAGGKVTFKKYRSVLLPKVPG